MSNGEPTFEQDKTLPWNLWGKRTVLFFFYDFWFRVAAAGFVVLVVFLGLFLPKIWQTSPPDFTPVIKVSGLDKVQAWQLRRAALKHEERNEIGDAMYSWRSAILNNSADPDLHRGAIRTLLRQETPSRDYLSFGVRETFWLLRLTRTNAADLDLSTQLYEKYGLHELTLESLRGGLDGKEPATIKRLLRACFLRGDMPLFDTVVRKAPPAVTDDPEMRVYIAAWRAGWGVPGEIREGRAALVKALGDPALRKLAHQLRLRVALAHGELREYVESFEYLRDNHIDRVDDHVNYWRLMALSGRRADAVKEALAYSNPPTSPGEAINMASAYQFLGLDKQAVEFVDKYLPMFPWFGELWQFQANQLMTQKRWDELRGLAVNLRADEISRGVLGGYSYYLEGVAQMGMGRADLAADSFKKTPTLPYDSPMRAFGTACVLNRLGYAEPAAELLRIVEGSLTNRAEFYNQLTIASFQSRQTDGLLAAAERARELDPGNRNYINNYAAALLALRQRPSEALRLTLEILAINPENPGAMINHAAALNQNHRYAEAEAVLKKIDSFNLTQDAAAIYNLALFEAYLGLGRSKEAREIRERIETVRLLPEQVKWIESTSARLNSKGG